MKKGLILSALFRFRNISVFALCLGLIYAYQNSMFISDVNNVQNLFTFPIQYQLLAALIIYSGLTIQTLTSKSFAESFIKRKKVQEIRQLNNTCVSLAVEAKKHTNAIYYQRLKKVADAKNEILRSFFRGEHSFLKEKIVEQTLNLVISYIKLLTNYCIRSKEAGNTDLNTIAGRINSNNRKLNFTKDPRAASDIKNVLELDEKLIERIKEEKVELEAINAKLDYMESLINMFKHQILSSLESEDMVEKLETAVNEAAALDNVLNERRRGRVRI